MDVEGFRFFAIRDKANALIDLRMFFVANNGPITAMYGFDAKSSKARQAAANSAIEKSRRLERMKESVTKVGVEPPNPKSQTLPVTADSMVPGGQSSARILIGKVDKNGFSVRLTVLHKKPEDNFSVEVPFGGDPGDLKGKTFNGEALFLVDSKPEVAKVELALMDIGN